jgi:DNA-binding CsgD family transcriptional regulator
VVIVGEAGVGKTRLAREAVSRAQRAGAAIEWVRGTLAAAAIPLAPVVELLPAGRTYDDPLRVLQTGAELLLARAGNRPLVVGFDDAHLLDPGSAAFMLHLAAKGAFVVVTSRADALPADAVIALWKDEGALRLELGPFGASESAELLEAQLGGPAERVAQHWAHAASAGNPLYLRELVSDAVRTGALDSEAELWRLRGREPPGAALTSLVSRRLNGIGGHARLALALVDIGQPLAAEIAAEAGRPGALRTLEASGLITIDGAGEQRLVRLAHPLYGEVARLKASVESLDMLRLRLAAAVRQRPLRPGDALRVATWLRDARAPIDAELLLEAAAEAYGARDPKLAADLASRAERAGGGAAATFARGRAMLALGRHAEAEQALATIEGALPREQALAYLFTRINALIWGLGRGEEARRLVGRAARWWPDPPWREQLAGMRLMVLSATGAAAAAAELADDLAAQPRRDPGVDGLLATSGAIAWLHSGRSATAQTHADRALPPPGADERLGDRELAGLVSWALTRIEAGREWDGAEERVERIERAALARGDRVSAGPATGLLGHLALARGRPLTAIRLLREATGHLEGHDPRGLAVVVSGQIAHAHALLGDAGRAREADADARYRLGDRPAAWHEDVVLTLGRAWVLAAEGELTRAAESLLERAAAIRELPVFRAQLLADALSLGAAPAIVARELAEVVDGCDTPLAAAVAAHAAALASADPAALLGASEALAQIGALLVAAEAAAQAEAILAAEGRPAAARRAAALGARLLARCEGAATPALRATRPEPAQLSRRERELAELAARGHANAEIARRLTVSVRTVESHLYHAMSKLGVARREEIAGALGVRDGDAGSEAGPRPGSEPSGDHGLAQDA